MIKRYTKPEMGNIWDLQNKYQCWLDVEIAACRAMAKLNMIPEEDLQNIIDKADFEVERIDEIEKETKHDVIAFLTNVAEHVGPSSRFIHYGLTSSDILDTGLALQLKQAGTLIIKKLITFADVLKKQALTHKNTLCIGRSHGIHAEPTSFGLKFALWYDETLRNIERMEKATAIVSIGQFSGAVGNYAHLSPEIEKYACEFLELDNVNVATQVIQRDRHAEFMSALALTASTIEKVSMEIRHLQRTEVLEAEENFTKGQKGSSAMPHKRNPIATEQMCGLARLIRSNAHAAMENNALWHERDISHSSVERVILPDSTILVHYMLEKMITLIDNLLLYPENMMKNIELTNGLVFSQPMLLKLTEKGITREQSYSFIQRNAMKCWREKKPFEEYIRNDAEIMEYLTEEDLQNVFSYERYLKNVDYIFNRVGIVQ